MRSLPLALKHYANQIDSLEDCTWHPHPFHRISTVTLTMIGRIVLPGDGGWVGKGWPRAPHLLPPLLPLPPPSERSCSWITTGTLYILLSFCFCKFSSLFFCIHFYRCSTGLCSRPSPLLSLHYSSYSSYSCLIPLLL